MVPHLVTALNGPINELEQRILESMSAIERWFRLEWMEHTPAFYCAVDVRNAGFKLAPVDTNLYPDGWNNLSPEMLPLAVQAAMAAIEKICPEAKNLLLVPDNDIHNSFYLSNLARLARIFNLAGLNVRLGSLSNEVKAPVALSLPEMILLRRVLKPRLIATFVGVTAVGIVAVGYLFNAILQKGTTCTSRSSAPAAPTASTWRRPPARR